jgi:hypothetical protein
MRQSRAANPAKEHFVLVKDQEGHLFSRSITVMPLRKRMLQSRIITSVPPWRDPEMDCPRCPCKRHKYDSRIYEVDTATREGASGGVYKGAQQSYE